jgi:hypothetical protein
VSNDNSSKIPSITEVLSNLQDAVIDARTFGRQTRTQDHELRQKLEEARPKLREWTVGDLIAELQKFDPSKTIGIKAACCGHTHESFVVRYPDDADCFNNETDVMLQSD